MKINPDFVPTTLEQAVAELAKSLEPHDLLVIGSNQEPVGPLHFGFGRVLRGAWSMWEDTPLTRDIKTRFKIGHGDDIYGLILHCLWRDVRKEAWKAQEKAADYIHFWQRQGLDPITQKEAE